MRSYTRRRRPAIRKSKQPLSIGIVTPDRAIGCDETLRRILGVLDGTVSRGAVNEAVADFINFDPHEMSSASPWLRDRLADVHGRWDEIFADFLGMTLWQISHARQCHYCGSRRQYHTTKRNGGYVGILCGNCGHVAINDSIIRQWRQLRGAV